MAYQKNWPTLLAYTVAVVVFVVVAVSAIMYATGYRLDFKTWTIKETGVLAVTSKPSGATVILNDVPSVRKTPFTLRNALPGAYHLKLTLEGYQPYEKNIMVLSNQATEEHNIDLVLADLQPKPVADKIEAVVHIGSEFLAFTTENEFVKVGTPNTPLGFDKVPTNIKTILSQTTSLFLAKKHDSTANLALGVVANNRRWLVIVDPSGYRGQSFGAPFNQVTAENLFWIDADRLLLKIGDTVYTLDLNLNQTNLYAKGILGMTYANGKLYYAIRDATGRPALYRDGNLFDDRAAEPITDNLPVGSTYEIMATPEEAFGVLAHNRSGVGLWWVAVNPTSKDASYKQTKLASSVHGTLYDNLNDIIFFVQNRTAFVYDIAESETIELRQFTDTPQLIDKRNESVFIRSANKFWVTDPSFSNLYVINDASNSTLLVGTDSRRVWTLKAGQLNEWVLRLPGQGLFGDLPNWVGRVRG